MLAFTSHCCLRCSTLDAIFKTPSYWVTSQKLTFSRLQPLTYSLLAILHWLATLTVQRKLTVFYWWLSKSLGKSVALLCW